MKNVAWEAFQVQRADLRYECATIVADYLAGRTDDITVGRVSGALQMLLSLPYAVVPSEQLRWTIRDAHLINTRRRLACGCKQYKKCAQFPQVDIDDLAERLDRNSDLSGGGTYVDHEEY